MFFRDIAMLSHTWIAFPGRYCQEVCVEERCNELPEQWTYSENNHPFTYLNLILIIQIEIYSVVINPHSFIIQFSFKESKGRHCVQKYFIHYMVCYFILLTRRRRNPSEYKRMRYF